MIGTKIYKKNLDKNLFDKCVKWCSETKKGEINNFGEYYEVTEPMAMEKIFSKKIEILNAKSYLSETDYCVVKCSELGLEMSKEYPEIFRKRAEARRKINELESMETKNANQL